MKNKLAAVLSNSFSYQRLIPSAKSSLLSVVSGLVFCSVAVVAQTTSGSNTISTADYTLTIITKDSSETNPNHFNEVSTTDFTKGQTKKAFNRSIALNDGGVVWVTQDPSKVTPKLNVTGASSVTVHEGAFVTPMSFTLSTNYAHYIDHWVLTVYNETDEDFTTPLAQFKGNELAIDQTVKWDGKTANREELQSGDRLVYVLRATGKDGHVDETNTRSIALKSYYKNQVDEPVVLSGSNALESNLRLQTIPVYGSSVRVSGRDIVEGNRITINGNPMTLSERKFVTETILPEGQYQFAVNITDNAQQQYTKNLDIKLDGQYLFMIGLADITAGEGSVGGNLETLSDGDEQLDGDIFVNGRLAFYLKGKVQGKYLLTAQMDTETAPIEDIFDDIHKKDPESIFRRLDPEQYYPVYGDDSTLVDDTDSQGKLYVRVDWDKSKALWGNFNTDFTGTELSSFNRSLYGAKLNHKSTQVTSRGDNRTDVSVFGSETQSAYRHNQFLGTGGSLYYLKDKDIVDGSEKIWIEVRENENSERAIESVVLVEGQDYQIDDYQGRIILNRPLLQVVKQANSSLIKDNALDGSQVFLMVDYEYVPSDFESDNVSYGARGKAWLTNNIAIGGTVIHESRDTDDYNHQGIDLTIQKAIGTYIKGEYAESESNQTLGSFLSSDGGLNFSPFSSNASEVGTDTQGAAYSIEARANLKDYSSKEGSIGAWYKHREAGFSSANTDTTIDTIDAGVSALVTLTESLKASLKATLLEVEATSKDTSISLQADYKVSEKVTVAAEVRQVTEKDLVNSDNDGEGTLAALKLGYGFSKDFNVYAIAQGTIAESGGYESNDLLTLGATSNLSKKVDLNAEVSSGDRGDSALIGARYKASNDYDLYTNYTMARDSGDNQERNIVTIGQRKSVSDQLKVYTEHQYTHEDAQAGLGNTFGLDYKLNNKLNTTFSYQQATLEQTSGGTVDRDALTVGLNYKQDHTEASARVEFRNDKGESEHTKQFVTTNKVNHRVSPSLRVQGKLNYSETKDQLDNDLDAMFAEAGVGFAYRPVNNDRHNILGRVTYQYDLSPVNQSDEVDEKSLIASLENSYQLNQRWEIGGKVAYKQGEVRSDRNTGEWSKNNATLASARARYHMTHNWDLMAQYHWLDSIESKDTQHGAMVSVDRQIGQNLKLGVGYNFTDFNDDLSDKIESAEGWFLNLVGKF
ncbi:hypothetical protein [Leucothrix arctica]|uniref:Autotransporter domain-containing protein n=1 Tax=Leucothrix arctica TaxID=1481894 RepID=A0A317C3W5_9GAMM|nr:hypothetical protein [Leucothrix arctica]PWQ92997.1 hypothetical protein DKT75_21705 [Leucothrix arctica]